MKVTVAASPIPGVYVAVLIDVSLAIVPVPFDVHNIPELLVALAPVVIGIDVALLHTQKLEPATAVGAAVIDMFEPFWEPLAGGKLETTLIL